MADHKPLPGVMTKFRIDELSGVTRPAQGGAKAVIMKRADDNPTPSGVNKAGDGASKEDPVSNAIKKALGLPDTATEEEVVGAISKALGSSETNAAAIAKANEERDRAVRKASMSADEQDYCKAMTDDEKDAFMKKPPADRASAMKKARDDDEVLEGPAGTSIRKSEVGAGVFAILKAQATENAALRASFEKSEAERRTATFAKRAIEEFPHLAGSVADRALVLKHLDTADAATKTAAEAILKAAEGSAKLAFTKLGHNDGSQAEDGTPDGAEAKLRKLAEDKAAASGGKLTFAKAYDEVIQAHPDLYEEALGLDAD
jgi:hypothetical protein